VAFSYGHGQGALINHLTSQEVELNAAIGRVQSQLNVIASKLDEMSAARIAAAQRPNGQETRSRRPGEKSSAVEEERWKQITAHLDQQQRQLNQTEANLAKTRSDLEGSLNSTYRELTGSIAKTHEELVAFEKRGERNYFEFDLSKAKEFQRSGPVMLSLRKADPKHQTFDLAIIASDKELTKKRVNLYEPIWIYDTGGSQPVQVIINQINTNLVHGYVTAPKYS
jgi:chromosome segregation ATPase